VYPANFQKIINETKKIAKKYIFKVQEKVNGNDIILIVIATWRKKFIVCPLFSNIDPDHKKNANGYMLKHKNKVYKYRKFEKICEQIEEIIR
jgi:hypothetical protein